jgi:hypothetical protein
MFRAYPDRIQKHLFYVTLTGGRKRLLFMCFMSTADGGSIPLPISDSLFLAGFLKQEKRRLSPFVTLLHL